MKLSGILLSLLLLTSQAMACGSYEECMDKVDATPNGNMRFRSGGADSSIDLNVARTLKAIAYKLDEISKKLDGPPAHVLPSKTSDDGNNRWLNKTSCVEHDGKYYWKGTTIPIAKESCSDVN